jgi:uncharacterized protein
MLACLDHSDVDAGSRRGAPERLCIATRAVKPVTEMIRFVVGPDGMVVPDVKGKLPGRGVWVTGRHAALAAAISRKGFGRGFKRDVQVPPDLVATTERLLERSVLDALAIAYKAGLVAAGFAKVEAALGAGSVVALLHAREAASDGVRKLDSVLRRQGFEERGRPAVIDRFTSMQLDLALGRSNVVHAAVLAGPASARFLERWRVLERFLGDDPGSPGSAQVSETEVP